jgi:hypothetical protein
MDSEEYETHDIYLAAYFFVCGCKFLRKYKQGPRVYFIFTNPAGSMKQLRDAYLADHGLVPAKKYGDEIQRFKAMCFDLVPLILSVGALCKFLA